MADVVANVRRSLVQVRSSRRGAGAGSIWHPDGLIVTNAHVVQSRRLEVTLPDGREMGAQLVAHDRGLDLAALSVDADGLPAIEIGDSRGLLPGQVVMSMGHPWGVEGAVSAGIVIGLETNVPEAASNGREWVVANLPLRPGHSGGPMMDAEGRLIGINTMITGPEIAMAVPVHVVKDFLNEMLRKEQGRVTKV
jgi:serine protease Do